MHLAAEEGCAQIVGILAAAGERLAFPQRNHLIRSATISPAAQPSHT
jgi:hypothetical protein